VCALLQAADVWFAYDDRSPTSTAVVKGITLGVPDDGFVGILGPNGAGKSTLLRLLAGTRRPQRGTIALDGTPLVQFSRTALARRMAVVPQETHLAFDYTAGEVAMMGRYPHLGPFEIEGPRDMAAVDEALAATGTRALKDRLFASLSGGEKQRVVIAAALAQIESSADSRYLLLDEPTASLDLAYQLEIGLLLRRLHDEGRAGIVISTHDIGLAGTLCDTLVLLRDGEVAAAGATDDVLTTANLLAVYGVEAEISRHPSGQRVVVPIRRSGEARP